jgi:hypothetical protein
MGRAALATSKPTPASAIIPIFRELEFILITKTARLRAAAQWVDRPSLLMERVYRSRALTKPVMRLDAVSLTAVRPNKARIATPGRVAIPPPTMKPAAAATAVERSGLSRIEFSICTISRLIPNLLRYVRAVSLKALSVLFVRALSDSSFHQWSGRFRFLRSFLSLQYFGPSGGARDRLPAPRYAPTLFSRDRN